MSYSNSFPTQRPSLNLVFNGGSDQLDSRLSYSRSSSGTAFSAEKHLSSENLLPYSNDLSNASWTKANTTASSGATGPDGTANASSVLETTANDGHSFYDNFEVVNGVSYTFVAFVKGNGRTKVKFQCQAQPTIANVEFDLTAVTSTVLTGSAVSHAIVASGGTGWYRCSVTVVAGGTGAGYHQIHISDGSSYSYAGDITKGVFIFGTSVSSTQQLYVSETSGQIHREFAPTLKTAAADAPRFEYAADGQSVGTALGLLVESQSSNLLTYSEDWTNSDFTKFVAITSNAGIAPTGELSADLVAATSSTGDHLTRQSLTIVSGQTFTMSVFAKASGCNFVRIGGASTAAMPAQASFDLANGTVGTVDYGTAQIEDVGNGYYRCSVTGTAASSSSTHFQVRLMQSDNTPSWTGDDFSGVLLFGQMAEQSSSVSSYIKTTSSSVSRAADSCSVLLSDAGYTGGKVSGIVEAKNIGKPYPTLATLTDSTANQRILVQGNDAGTYVSSYIVTDGAVVAGPTSALTAASSKVGFRCDTDNFGTVVNGGTVATDTSGAQPATMTTLHIGQKQDGNFQVNGHIGRLSLYAAALSDTELKSLTTS